nr:putative glycoside hydrolase [Pseudoalteromonas sp. H100]
MQGRAKGDWNYQLQSGGQTKDIHTPSGNIKGLTMIEADKNIQGDAKEFTWSGANNASVLISSSWYREDLSQYLINKKRANV